VDEEKFLLKLQQADEEAWRRFVERFDFSMVACALRHVKSRATAEDIAEDAMSRLVSSIKGFTYQGIPLDVWVYKIERNALLDYYRALRHVKSRATAEDIAEDAVSRLVSSIKGFTCQGIPLDVWVYKIERNALSDYYRQQTGYPMFPFQEFMDVHSAGLLKDPYELAEAADTKAVVYEVTDHLEEP